MTEILSKFKVVIPVKISCKDNKKILFYPPEWQKGGDFSDFNGNGYAVLTGEENGITVIDIDSETALNELQKRYDINLFNECKFIVKTKKGWHFYFKYTPELKTTTSFRGITGVDIRNDGANVIIKVPENLPCASYKILKNDSFVEIPNRLLYLEPKNAKDTHYAGGIIQAVEPVKERKGYPLNLLAKEFFKSEFMQGQLYFLNDKAKSFLKRITPYDYRDGTRGEHYRAIFEKKGYIEPNDILEGDGSAYLSKVAAILAADETIDYNTYVKILNKLNHSWDYPMPQSRLENTIIKNGEIKINGENIWKFNPNWLAEFEDKSKINFLKAEGVTVFFEPNLAKYITYNEETKQLFIHKKQDFSQLMLSLTGEKFQEWSDLPVKIMTFNPVRLQKEYKEAGIEYFNTFELSPLLKLAMKKELPVKKPEFILKIIENLIPEEEKRELFLNWLGVWWTTRQKSLVSWVFISPQGAGKGILTDLIIANVVGQNFASLEVSEDLLEDKFNGWLKDKMFISFNEINTLTRDRFKNRNKIKRLITGDFFQLRMMNANPVDYPNYANFIFSSNDSVPLDIEETDRRFNVCLAKAPLKEFEWFNSVEDVKRIVLEELPDFVRYVTSRPLNVDDYNKVINDEPKKLIVRDNLTTLDEFFYRLKNNDFESFEDDLSAYPQGELLLKEIKTALFYKKIETKTVKEILDLIAPFMRISLTKVTREAKRRGFRRVKSNNKIYLEWD